MRRIIFNIFIIISFVFFLGFVPKIVVMNEVGNATRFVRVYPNIVIDRSPNMEEWLELKDGVLFVKEPEENSTKEHRLAWEQVKKMEEIRWESE